MVEQMVEQRSERRASRWLRWSLVGLVVAATAGAGLAVTQAAGPRAGAGATGDRASRSIGGGPAGYGGCWAGAARPGGGLGMMGPGPRAGAGAWSRLGPASGATIGWRLTTEELEQRLELVTQRLAALKDPKTVAAYRQIHPEWTDEDARQWVDTLTQRLTAVEQALRDALAARQGQTGVPASSAPPSATPSPAPSTPPSEVPAQAQVQS